MTLRRNEILRLRIAGEQDVFLARQRGREVAALVGLDHQDQVRVATSLSELSRELNLLDTPTTVVLSVAADPPALMIGAAWTGQLPRAGDRDGLAAVEGIAAAARLLDACRLSRHAGGGSVALTKRLPPGALAPDDAQIVEMRTAVGRSRPGNALDALRSQNQDLLQALEDLRARQEDLLCVNAELEETNRGVLALHAELSDELEQTNRGVVALYAELDEASARLREASESKNGFWANVSHELRTPLNSVIGLSRLLLDAGSEPLTEEQRYQVELIRGSGTLLLTLVNDLLDVAKAESGQIEADPVPTDLGAVFDELRAALRPVVTTPDVELVVEDPVGVGVVRTDPVLLGRILRNLVSNGLKFTPRGEVRCRAVPASAAGWLEVEVADTGIGIAPVHQHRVFEEFYQIPGPWRAERGTGLGLPYSRRLAEILGGTLDLVSEPGVGTRVTLRLPLDHGAEPTTSRFGSVLIVDDDPAFRTVLHRAVEVGADRVIEVGDGNGALRSLRAHRPDLVLLDLNIPAPDGEAVLREMRRDPELSAVPVVVVTAADLDHARRRRLTATAAVVIKADLSTAVLVAAADDAARLVGDHR